MPGYGVPIGTKYDEVAFGFNDGVINGLLRAELGFDGIVCSDWGVISDHRIMGEPHVARAWGVEHLSPSDRTLLALNAGVDQFGGESRTQLIVDLVASGALSASRLDRSVQRLLTEKFRLGLFDRRRYVDPDLADRTAGSADFRAARPTGAEPFRHRPGQPLPARGERRPALRRGRGPGRRGRLRRGRDRSRPGRRGDTATVDAL